MNFIDQFNPTGALVGGFLTTAAQEYLGVSNPMLPLLGASVVGAVVSKVKKIYNEQKDVLPGAMTLATLLNRVQTKIGVQFFTVVVKKDQNVIFNKVQNYIMHKYAPVLIRGSISKTDNVNISMNLDGSLFSVPIYDLFEHHRIVITIFEKSNEKSNDIYIKICSKTLNVEGLKRYLQHLLSMRLGVSTINVHQPIIQNPIKYNNQNNKDQTTVKWSSCRIQTNKNFRNTILTDEVYTNLVDDLKKFSGDEDYYNDKGIPYKRGYLLYGPPGTGKTSIIKAIASFYGMDVYLINMGDIETEKEMSMVFQGTRTANGYHMLVFEDIDRCPIFQTIDVYHYDAKRIKSLMRTFLNELDGVIETPKRITLLTANDEKAIVKIAALCRPGRIDKQIKLGYCDAKQLCHLYNHFSDCKEELELKELKKEVTPAQVVKHILKNPEMTPDEFKKEIDIIAEIEVKEQKLCAKLNKTPRNRGRRMGRRGGGHDPVSRQRYIMNRRKRELKRLETAQQKFFDRHRVKREQIKKSEEMLQKRIVSRDKSKALEKVRKQKEKEREKKRKARERAKSKERPRKRRKVAQT